MKEMLTYVWLLIFIILLFIEIITINLVSIWFALSALIVSLLSIFIKNNNILLLLFVNLSIIFLILTRPILNKYLKTKNYNFQTLNKKVKIVDFENGEYIVKFKGSKWNAISFENEKEYKIGDEVEILRFEGNKIIIK